MITVSQQNSIDNDDIARSNMMLKPNVLLEADLPQLDQSIDIGNVRFPFCIVWTALPVITSVVPVVGHTGICTSEGIIHDFGGSYYIAIDDFTFSAPQKYVVLDHQGIDPQFWDECVEKADRKFRRTEHNMLKNNCHSHVAEVLNLLKYRGKSSWSMFDIWWLVVKEGKVIKEAKKAK